MATIVDWLVNQGHWVRSSVADLPALHTVPEAERSWAALAGGLALVLSRTDPRDIEQQRRACLEAYLQIRKTLAARKSPRVSRKLLLQAAAEIEHVADPLTKAALRACLRPAGVPSQATSPSEAALEAAAKSLQQGSGDDAFAETRLSPEVFMDRSTTLRTALAEKRQAKG